MQWADNDLGHVPAWDRDDRITPADWPSVLAALVLGMALLPMVGAVLTLGDAFARWLGGL